MALARTLLRCLLAAVLVLLVTAPSTIHAQGVSTSKYENFCETTRLQIKNGTITYLDGRLYLNATVSTDAVIRQGEAQIEVRFLGRSIFDRVPDFCELANGACNKPSTEFLVTYNVTVPGLQGNPEGVQVDIRIKVLDGRQTLGCFFVTFAFDDNLLSLAIRTFSLVVLGISTFLGVLSVVLSTAQQVSDISEAAAKTLDRPLSMISTGALDQFVQQAQPAAAPLTGAEAPVTFDAPAAPVDPSSAAQPGPATFDAPGGGTASGPATFDTPGTTVDPSAGASGPVTFDAPGTTVEPSSAPSGPATFDAPGTTVDPSTAPSGPATFDAPGTTVDPSTAPSGPATFDVPGTVDPSTAPSGPATFDAPGTTLDPSSAPSGPATFDAPGTTADPSAAPSGPATFDAPTPGGISNAGPAAPVTAPATGPATFDVPASVSNPAAPGTLNVPTGGAATAASAAAAPPAAVPPVTDGSGGYMSAPWLFDIIHYFQFITLTGQLQLNYPAVFASFTRIFHFANGGIKIGFIEKAASQWTGAEPTFDRSRPAAPNTLSALISAEDVGLTQFVLDSNMHPANFFAHILITLLITLLVATAFSAVVALILYRVGEWKREKQEREELAKGGSGSLKRRVSEKKTRRVRERRKAVLVRFCLANLVRTWMVLQYPLTVASGYWLSHFASSAAAPPSVTLVAAVVLVGVCIALPSLLIYSVMSVRPRDKLFTDPRWLETVGPLYDHLRRDRVWFCAVQIAYFSAQGCIVGLYPKNSPKRMVETLGTPQWVAALMQPLLLVLLEIGFMVVMWKADPIADRWSARVQWAVNWSRLAVLVCVCCFVAPEYTRNLSADELKDSLNLSNLSTGNGVATFRTVVAYIAALVHTLLIISLLILLIRRVYLWLRQFYLSRRAAATSTIDRSAGRRTTFLGKLAGSLTKVGVGKKVEDALEEDTRDGKERAALPEKGGKDVKA
ncbi:hypothetical protein HDU96_008051 [Phlyctochytrium bullatum]|nr:hypothetical protein HDU96_008051 [Phlyctochytrium bullatum]